MKIKNKKNMPKRIIIMILGNLLIALGITAYRTGILGVDPFSCMNLGISLFIHRDFGTCQLIMNIMLFIIVFILMRGMIGAGTIVNMAGIGYCVDFFTWLSANVFHISASLPVKFICLISGTLLVGLGCAFYMETNMGTSPYDSLGFIIEKVTKSKIRFSAARIITDLTCVIIGTVFCLMSKNSFALVLGIGTIVNAACTGPLISFFRKHIAKPMLTRQADKTASHDTTI